MEYIFGTTLFIAEDELCYYDASFVENPSDPEDELSCYDAFSLENPLDLEDDNLFDVDDDSELPVAKEIPLVKEVHLVYVVEMY